MAKKRFDRALTKIMGTKDPLSLSIRGHAFIDSLLSKGISEILPFPHSVEIERTGFLLKVDLAIALGMIAKDSRAVFVTFNSIRNSFAHKSTTSFEIEDAKNLFNCLSKVQRHALSQKFSDYGKPRDVLKDCVAVMAIELEGVILRLRKDKLHAEVLHEMVEELRANSEPVKEPNRISREVEQRMQKKKLERPITFYDEL